MIDLRNPKASNISPSVLGFMSRKDGAYTVRGNSPIGNGVLAYATDEDEAEFILSKMKKEEGFTSLTTKPTDE